jgi:predicted AAA+ superfamily ATPase
VSKKDKIARYLKDSIQDLAKTGQCRLVVLDEVHKSAKWKQKIKGIFDHDNEEVSVLVTGSARLNVYVKGGDSLMGRYLPLIQEMNGAFSKLPSGNFRSPSHRYRGQ